MLKHYLANMFIMLIDSFFLFYIKFKKYNRSILENTGEVPVWLYIVAVCTLVGTIGVNIAEVIILKRQQKLTAVYLVLSIILLMIPYLVYKFV